METIKFLQSFSSPFWDTFFQSLTILGDDSIFMLVAALIFWCLHKDFGYRLVLTYLTSGMLNVALKEIFMIARPIGEPGIRSLRTETADGYSFPSGHTQCAASLVTSLMTQLHQSWFYWIGVILIFLVGLSRIYLGVHWPVDVICGALIGVIWVLICNRVYDYAETTGKRSILLLVLLPLFTGMFFFPTANYFKTAGASLGFFCGYLVEPWFISYQVAAPFLKQVLKYVFGISVLLAIRLSLKRILPHVPLSDFIRYLLMSIWVTILAPISFRYLNLAAVRVRG